MNPATAKWVDIFLDIISYELAHPYDGQLLSQQCYRWVQAYPVGARIVIGTFGILLTCHLGYLLPERYDVWRKSLWRRILRYREYS